MQQQMTGWQWHQLDHMQIICHSLQTDNHTSTSPLSFYRPDALPATQSTASKHWNKHNRKQIHGNVENWSPHRISLDFVCSAWRRSPLHDSCNSLVSQQAHKVYVYSTVQQTAMENSASLLTAKLKINQLIDWSFDWSLNQSIKLLINRSINRLINHTMPESEALVLTFKAHVTQAGFQRREPAPVN